MVIPGMALVDPASSPYRFGGFLLEPGRRALTLSGQAEPLSSRGFDLLLFLVEQRERVVTKDELLSRVWQGSIVEENNLAVQVSAVRRSLGQGPGGAQFILTVPGRGYRFVAPVEHLGCETPAEPVAIVPKAEPVLGLLPEPVLGLLPGPVAGLSPEPVPGLSAGPVLGLTAGPAPGSSAEPVLRLSAGPVLAAVAEPASTAAADRATAANPAGTPVRRWASGSRRMAGASVVLGGSLALMALAGPGLWRRHAPGPPRLSIVVLPFRNLGGDAQQDYLADAIGDDLTTDLSHIAGSTVIARESADTYKGHAVAADLIGRALNVRYLLEGSLRDEGGTLHINAQLIEAANGTHLWASTFDVTRDRLGHAREEIVRHIASALNFTLVQVEGDRSLRERPDNPDAVDLYFRARSILDRGNTLESLRAAQDLLQQAVAAAPDFSEALAQLGLVLLKKQTSFDDPDEQRDYVQAKRVIGRAASMASQSPISIAALGMLAFTDRRCEEAQPDFRLALSIDPNNVLALAGLGRCARALGQMEEMIADLKDVLRIDPLAPQNGQRRHLIGMGYLMLGKPRDAKAWFDLAGAGLSDTGAPETTLGWQEWRQVYMIAVAQLSGRTAEAAQLYRNYNHLRPHRTVWQLGAYDSKALSRLDGHAAYLAALHAAGMPTYMQEDADFRIAPTASPGVGGDLDPTPCSVPGAATIDTKAVNALLLSPTKPIILDLGRGAAVIPGAVWIWEKGIQDDKDRLLTEAQDHAGPVRDRAVIVMGDGPLGWQSYNGVLKLVANNYQHVLWYRGGEAAWASSGYLSEDRRKP